MNNFIFHIGMHKCASTTLQNQVLIQEPGYIGVSKELYHNGEKNFGKEFQDLAPVGGRQIGSIRGVNDWYKRVLGNQEKTNITVDHFIVSNEFLCQSNKISKRPIIKFLDKVNKKVLGDDKIKVIIVFRNQSTMMASSYAQTSDTNNNASQKDFEKYIKSNLKNSNYSYYDWGAWAEELVNAFGVENVCILLLEEMSEFSFWDELTSFIEANSLQASELHKQNKISKKNSNKLSSRTWGLKPFDVSKKAKEDINKVKRFFAGLGLDSKRQNEVWSKLVSLREYYLKKNLSDNDEEVEENFKLTETLSNNIKKKYEDSNNKLAQILGRDISHLGY